MSVGTEYRGEGSKRKKKKTKRGEGTDWGEEEVEETGNLGVRKSGEKESDKERRKDTFDIRLGPKPRSRYEPLSLSADGQH